MNKPDTIVTLGGFAFRAPEVPELIPWGGAQALAIHKMPGGRRIIDAMGRDDRPLEWSGIFFGSEADDRARQVDAMRIAGLPVVLSWGEHSYLVVIREFNADYQRKYQQPYHICCEVVQDLAAPLGASTQLGVDDVVANDLGTVDTIVAQIKAINTDVKTAMAPVQTAIDAVHTAVDAVSDIATASNSVIQSILEPIATARTEIATLTASVGNAIQNIGTVGGLFPNTTLAHNIATFNNQVANVQQQTLLVQLDSVMGRIQQNVTNAPTDADTVTQAGGNLFDLAAKRYGDASKWADIARANKLGDPKLSGVNTVKLPKNTGDTGGVYGG